MKRWTMIILFVIAAAAGLLAGCDTLIPPVPTATDTPTESAAAPTLTPSVEPDDEIGEPPVLPDEGDDEIRLMVWMPEALTPVEGTPGAEVLLEQFGAFDALHDTLSVEALPKLTVGPGSTLAYLRSAPDVAPSILPDLALIDRDALVQAANEGLLVPAEPLVDAGLVEDLYPVSVALGEVNDELVGVPYLLQTQHVVYREAAFETGPRSFEDALSAGVGFSFPAGTPGSVNRTVLAQYLAAGGTLTDFDGTPLLDADALTEVLTFYAAAREANVFDPALFRITDPTESWEQYVQRQTEMAVVSSTTFLAERGEVRSTGVTWVPTLDGTPIALATGWVWVITTDDPARQEAALTLLDYLMNPVNHGLYAEAAGWLPSQPGALAAWAEVDLYARFADTLLAAARPLPDPGLREVIGTAIQDALEDVVLNDDTPLEAATDAATRVNPPDTTTP